jgi:hypothetical protein
MGSRAMTSRPVTHGSGRRGRPPSDASLTELATDIAVILLKLDDLKGEREQLAGGDDRQSLLYNRCSTNEYNEKFWDCVEKIISLPAQATAGLRVKAHTIELIQEQRDSSNSLTDSIMCGVGIRLALSLATDIQRWITRS